MKKLSNTLVVLLIVISAVFISCEKDDKADKQNAITLNNKEYKLEKGYVRKVVMLAKASAEVGYPFYLYCVSSDVTVNNYGATSGTGHEIVFHIFSPSEASIVDGIYYYDSYDKGIKGSFDNGAIYLDYDFSTLIKASQEMHITGGKLDIVKNGSTYTVKFEGTLSGGIEFSSYYVGSLTSLTVTK